MYVHYICINISFMFFFQTWYLAPMWMWNKGICCHVKHNTCSAPQCSLPRSAVSFVCCDSRCKVGRNTAATIQYTATLLFDKFTVVCRFPLLCLQYNDYKSSTVWYLFQVNHNIIHWPHMCLKKNLWHPTIVPAPSSSHIGRNPPELHILLHRCKGSTVQFGPGSLSANKKQQQELPGTDTTENSFLHAWLPFRKGFLHIVLMLVLVVWGLWKFHFNSTSCKFHSPKWIAGSEKSSLDQEKHTFSDVSLLYFLHQLLISTTKFDAPGVSKFVPAAASHDRQNSFAQPKWFEIWYLAMAP